LNFELLQVLPGMTSITLLYKSVNNLLAAEVMEINSEGKIYSVLAHYSEIANLKISI
jgi:predicted solute-binding protein